MPVDVPIDVAAKERVLTNPTTPEDEHEEITAVFLTRASDTSPVL